jgi:hypothetical protein
VLTVDRSQPFLKRTGPFELRRDHPLASLVDVTPAIVARRRLRYGCEAFREWISIGELWRNDDFTGLVDVARIAIYLDLCEPIVKTILGTITSDILLFTPGIGRYFG